jgi:tetratricopeptide (TPR) repeat protein
MDTVSLGFDFGGTGLGAAWAGPDGAAQAVAVADGQWPWVFRERGAKDGMTAFPSLKSRLGLVPAVRVGGRDVDPRSVLSRALADVRLRVEAEAGALVGQAVISVPVGYGSAQRTALRECAQAAGLSRLRLVSDSMNAVVAHAGTETSATFLVYAMGYRGFETGLIRAARGRFQALGYAHAPGLGGASFDESLIAVWIKETFPEGAPATWDGDAWENLRADAQALRERWTAAAAAHFPLFLPGGSAGGQRLLVVAQPYSEHLRGEVAATVARATGVLRDTSTAADEVDAVLLVGQCTRMWPVRELVAPLGRAVAALPETCLAVGAAHFARLLDSAPPVRDAEASQDRARAPAGPGPAAADGTPPVLDDKPPVLDDKPVPADDKNAAGTPAAFLAEARARAKTKQYDEAIQLAHEAWRRARPDQLEIFEGMIDIHCAAAESAGSGDFEEAERWLRCALTHEAGNERARHLLTELSYRCAAALSEAGQHDVAVQVLERALFVAAGHPPSRDLHKRLTRSGPSRPLPRPDC